MLARAWRRRPASPSRQDANVGLYAPDGTRKYLNQAERQRFLAAIPALSRMKHSFA
jgi:hypothetical protein